MQEKNLIIYTAIFGDFDTLTPPEIVSKNVKYVCFTDKKIECYPWEIRIIKPKFNNLRKENRMYKILSHIFFKEYQYSVYIDGNYTLKSDLAGYVEDWLGKNDIATLKHYRRNCIYEEAKHIIKKNRDSKKVIKNQIKKYKREGYPKNNGLTQGGFIIRRHTKKIKNFNELWWNEVKNHSFRDQISFKFVLFKLNLNCSIIPIPKSQFSKIAILNPHKKKPDLTYSDYTLKMLISHFIKKSKILKRITHLFNPISIFNLFYNIFIINLPKRLKIPNFIYYFIKFIY